MSFCVRAMLAERMAVKMPMAATMSMACCALAKSGEVRATK
jgi:hypothetical protein